MSLEDRPKTRIRAFVIISSDKKFRPLIDVLKAVSREVGARFALPNEISIRPMPFRDSVYSEIARCDLVVADVSQANPNIYYEIGLAHALRKPSILLTQKKGEELPSNLIGYPVISYTMTNEGLAEFQKRFRSFLVDFISAPRRIRPFQPFPARLVYPPFIINLEKLDPREFENLCFELITQMGFRRVEWEKELREVDVVATFPKEDPDGYEYQELWFISMGRRVPVEMILEMATMDPDRFFHRILRYPEGIEELYSKYKIRADVPVTILMILRREGPPPEFVEHALRRMERRLKERSYPFSIRVRWWDLPYLTKLIQQYPQIAFKYFSEEARAKSKYRKKPEELYNENVKLTEEILLT